MRYFGELYLTLRMSYDSEYLMFNKLLDQNQQYLLVLSSLRLEDPTRDEKITCIARKFDQMHVVLRLLRAYDSNDFQRSIYPLIAAVREKDVATASAAFEAATLAALEAADVPDVGVCKRVADLFEYGRFRQVSHQWLNFSKYVLMRIDRYLAQLLDKPSYAGAALSELENRFNRNNSRRYGMHLEHVYTQHEENRNLFTRDGVFDAVRFQDTRNLLGMVLLLKDKRNLSSNNEIYRDKVRTYTQSNVIWNEPAT